MSLPSSIADFVPCDRLLQKAIVQVAQKSLPLLFLFIHIEIRTYYHNKNFALRLALKESLTGSGT